MYVQQYRDLIEKTWENRELLQQPEVIDAIHAIIEALDKGRLRVAEPIGDHWQVNDWVKKAVILYFPITKMETIEVGPFEFHDKIPLKKDMPNKVCEWCPMLLRAMVHF